VSIILDVQWSDPDQVISISAGSEGGGAMCYNEFFHHQYPQVVKEWPPSAREIWVLTIAAKVWSHMLKGRKIQVVCDNDITVGVVNSGRTRDKIMLQCLRELAFVSASNDFLVKCVHGMGTHIRVAAHLSQWNQSHRHRAAFWERVKGLRTIEVQIGDKVGFTSNW
jgi:hypothetical protein